MKERILVVEDNFINSICALAAFHEDARIEDVVATGELGEALRQVEEFRPTIALLDINIIGGKGTEVGKVLAEKKIPFVYVTGIGKTIGHHENIEAIEIQSTELKTLERFTTVEKSSEIWAKAYEYALCQK